MALCEGEFVLIYGMLSIACAIAAEWAGNIVPLIYSYALIGYELFREEDPENWGSLGTAMWTLFQTMTLEGWADKQKTTFKTSPHETWIFYSTYLLFATYFVMNLFVAIVVNNLQELKEAEQREADKTHTHADLLAELNALQDRLKAFEDRVRATDERPA